MSSPVPRSLVADLTDALDSGGLDRRSFLRRGATIGIGAPALASLLAACSSAGGDTDSTTTPTADVPRGSGPPSEASASAVDRIVVGVRRGDANAGLDPVNMAEIGTYAVVSQSFEYLVGLAEDGAVEPSALAASWSPNEDGSVWTFVLRDGPVWADGSSLTSADVAATMDRVVESGSNALAGVLADGAVDSADERVAVFRLNEPNGNFPTLLSEDNPTAVITRADYRVGRTLDTHPEGTGPWILESFDAPAFIALFRQNPAWWGDSAGVERIELRGFDEHVQAVDAFERGDIDVIQRFDLLDNAALVEVPGLTLMTTPSSAHRQLWFNTRRGVFADQRVREAIALSIDRRAAVANIAAGCSVVGNDHPVHPSLGSMPFFDPTAVEQRRPDSERAMALLDQAGVAGLKTTLKTSRLASSVALADLVQAHGAGVGIDIVVEPEEAETFYRQTWCPVDDGSVPCFESADFGVIEYEHEAVPDVPFAKGLVSGGVWNASNFNNERFDQLVRDYRRSVDVAGQRSAIGAIQALLWREIPVVVPCFDDAVAARRSSVSGVRIYASGQVGLANARWT